MAYGSYAAVALADTRAVQALRNGLPQVLPDRCWQQGAYAGEVVPALLGGWLTSRPGLMCCKECIE